MKRTMAIVTVGNCVSFNFFFQMINFRFIPVVHQLNFVLIVSLGWATFLSLFNAKRDSQKKE